MLAAAILPILAGCGAGDGTPSVAPHGGIGGSIPGGGSGAGSPVATMAVGISDNKFDPSAIAVPIGATVTWTWSPVSELHNVTFADGTGSGNRSAGASARAIRAPETAYRLPAAREPTRGPSRLQETTQEVV